MGCVNLVNLDIILNRQPRNNFAPSRGIRLGDPLSAYLFLLVSEVLSRMIQVAVEKKLVEGMKISTHSPVISHILLR